MTWWKPSVIGNIPATNQQPLSSYKPLEEPEPKISTISHDILHFSARRLKVNASSQNGERSFFSRRRAKTQASSTSQTKLQENTVLEPPPTSHYTPDDNKSLKRPKKGTDVYNTSEIKRYSRALFEKEETPATGLSNFQSFNDALAKPAPYPYAPLETPKPSTVSSRTYSPRKEAPRTRYLSPGVWVYS